MQKDFEQHVKIVMAACVNLSEKDLHNDAQLVDNLYIDSLEILDIIMSLNEEFDIDIGGEELSKITTVGDICKEVERQLETKK